MGLGEISTQNCTATYCEWKIPDFLSWIKSHRTIVHSPQYQFLTGLFIFKLQTFSRDKCFDFGLARTGSVGRLKSIHLHYRFGVKKHDGTEFKSWIQAWTFASNGCSGGLWERVHVYEILRANVIGPDGALTLFSTLRAEEETADGGTQTGANGGNQEETKTNHPEDLGTVPKRGTKNFEKLSLNFKELLASGKDSDIIVRVQEHEFPAHKLIMGARSPVFERMFRHDMVEKKERAVDINDTSPEAFKEFLLYLYSGEVEEFSRNTGFDLYELSDKYDVQDLKLASMDFLAADLCLDTFCDVVILALQHKESVLLEKATKFFSENMTSIIVSPKWLSFIKDNAIEANELYIKALLPTGR